jgi:FlaA1/EpsC-like NDP-sugar epimerase
MVFIHDTLSVPLAWFLAYWLRFNLAPIPAEILAQAWHVLPIMVVSQTFACWCFGLYRGVWRFASMPDLTRIIKAILVGNLTALLTIFLMMRLEHLPRSVFPLYAMLLILMLGGSRFAYRWLKDKQGLLTGNPERVLIVGAGSAGDSLVRELLRESSNQYTPIAFVDDHPSQTGREIHGIRVMGTSKAIPHIVLKQHIDVIMIALPSANGAAMQRIIKLCEQTQKEVKTLPSVNDLVNGRVTLKNLRKISLQDLLGRDTVALDWQAIKHRLADKVVLISGGGGSIGSELCRQVLKQYPKKLIIIDNNEYNLFELEQELKHDVSSHKIEYQLIDICDAPAIWRQVKDHQPDVIFHAAAYKHVPLLERQIRAAIRNNVLGTHCLAQAAASHQVSQFILVSTDKAVNPTNLMGATKRAAELVCQAFNEQSATQFITVRFGNVLGSRGSVVETFQKQLEHGGPLTVTHPDVTRFFMTIQEASQLILQALALGQGGELLVLDMGTPVNIAYMAEQMIHLAGKKLGDEIAIQYVGLRPGEKLHEELFHQQEQHISTGHAKILQAMPRALDMLEFQAMIYALQAASRDYDETRMYQALIKLVPEYAAYHQVIESSPPTAKALAMIENA